MFQVYNAQSLCGGRAGDRVAVGRTEGPGTCWNHATENYSSEWGGGVGGGRGDRLCKNDSLKKKKKKGKSHSV